MATKFQQLITGDTNLDRVQSNVANTLNSLQSTQITVSYQGEQQKQEIASISPPYQGGNIIVIPLTMGQDNLVPHGLKRIPLIWTLASQDTETNVWQVKTSKLKNSNGDQSANDQFLNLWCGADCNISVWVN